MTRDAAKALARTGFESVSYWGCIPPGCGIKSGATPDQQRLHGRPITTRSLVEILEENSLKC